MTGFMPDMIQNWMGFDHSWSKNISDILVPREPVPLAYDTKTEIPINVVNY